jgi:hypothetical protein
MSANVSQIGIENRKIYNSKYERVYRNPISKGASPKPQNPFNKFKSKYLIIYFQL